MACGSSPHPNGVLDRVGDGRGGGHVGKLADALALVGRRPHLVLQQHGLQRWNVLRGGELEIAHVEGGHAAIDHRRLLAQTQAHALDDASIDLPLVRHGVEDRAHVMDRDQPLNADLAGVRVHLNLGHLGKEGGHRPRLGRLEDGYLRERLAALRGRERDGLVNG